MADERRWCCSHYTCNMKQHRITFTWFPAGLCNFQLFSNIRVGLTIGVLVEIHTSRETFILFKVYTGNRVTVENFSNFFVERAVNVIVSLLTFFLFFRRFENVGTIKLCNGLCIVSSCFE